MERMQLSLTELQKEWLYQKEKAERIKPSELIRRLIDKEREKEQERSKQ